MKTSDYDTPARYDRWDYCPGMTKGSGQPLTEVQKRAIAQELKEQAALKKKEKAVMK